MIVFNNNEICGDNSHIQHLHHSTTWFPTENNWRHKPFIHNIFILVQRLPMQYLTCHPKNLMKFIKVLRWHGKCTNGHLLTYNRHTYMKRTRRLNILCATVPVSYNHSIKCQLTKLKNLYKCLSYFICHNFMIVYLLSKQIPHNKSRYLIFGFAATTTKVLLVHTYKYF